MRSAEVIKEKVFPFFVDMSLGYDFLIKKDRKVGSAQMCFSPQDDPKDMLGDLGCPSFNFYFLSDFSEEGSIDLL